MLPLAIALLTLSSILAALALRGHLTARGHFCRKCKFDLQGLDPARDNPTCPECGRPLTTPKSTRPTLRRAHRPALALAAILFLLGASLTTLSATNNIPRILAVLPDRVVFTLSNLGLDDALTELANRLTGTRIPDAMLDRLVADALDRQADPDRAWDPRDGEFIAFAWISGRLSDDQLTRYIENSMDAEAVFPEHIRHGATNFAGQILHTRARRRAAINRMNIDRGQPGAILLWSKSVTTGVRHPEMTVEIPAHQGFSGTYLSAPTISVGTGSGYPADVPLATLDWSQIKPGDELTFFVTLRLTAVRESDNKQLAERFFTSEQTVRVLTPDEPLVRVNTSPETIDVFRRPTTLRISHAHIPPPDERDSEHFTIYLHADEMPVAVSGAVYAATESGEVRVTRFTMPAQPVGSSMMTMIWSLREVDPETSAAIVAQWRTAGRITLEIRPDPLFAEKTPRVTEILGVPVRFENIPVIDQAPPLAMYNDPHPSLIPAVPQTDPDPAP